jgi:hypothetical protein
VFLMVYMTAEVLVCGWVIQWLVLMLDPVLASWRACRMEILTVYELAMPSLVLH